VYCRCCTERWNSIRTAREMKGTRAVRCVLWPLFDHSGASLPWPEPRGIFEGAAGTLLRSGGGGGWGGVARTSGCGESVADVRFILVTTVVLSSNAKSKWKSLMVYSYGL